MVRKPDPFRFRKFLARQQARLAIIGFGHMPRVLDPFRFLLITVAGWMNQRQIEAIDYLREENRVLREQLGGRRLRLNDHQRRRLAARAKRLGRKVLAELATIVTLETLLRTTAGAIGASGAR